MAFWSAALGRQPEVSENYPEYAQFEDVTAGCYVLPLDVTSHASMESAVRMIESVDGAVGVLVNNAGYSQSGAIEAVPMDRVRAQFETNVFGTVDLTQLVLPKMRAQRSRVRYHGSCCRRAISSAFARSTRSPSGAAKRSRRWRSPGCCATAASPLR